MRKQILAQGIKSWAHGELLTTYGISYFTGPLISKKSDSVKEINKKITQKIQEFETKK